MLRRSLSVLVPVIAVFSLSGCYVRTRGAYYRPAVYVDPAPAPVVYTEANYQPAQFDGNPVYYTDDGQPYYYVDGSPYYIPSWHPNYNTYVVHYRSYGNYYRRWHRYNPPRHHRPPVVYHHRYRR